MEPLSSVQTYSVVADLLSKFHTAPEWIQALWLVSVPATVMGAGFCLLQTVREIAALLDWRGERQGVPLYAIYEEADGRWMMYARGTVRELPRDDAEEALLPSPIRRH